MSFQRWVVDGTRGPAPLPHWFTAYLAKFAVELACSTAMATFVTGALVLVTADLNAQFLTAVSTVIGLPNGVGSPLVVHVVVTALMLDRLMWCALTEHVDGQ